jgi:hypothetical protein
MRNTLIDVAVEWANLFGLDGSNDDLRDIKATSSFIEDDGGCVAQRN